MTIAPRRKDTKTVTAPRSVTILGATGSIGSSTVDLLKREPERFSVTALTANRNGVALAQLARELGASFAAVADPDAYRDLKAELSGSGIEAAAGPAAVTEAARKPAEWVIGAITGAAGLEPALAAIERGATLALANKECLVCAGSLFMRRAGERRAGARSTAELACSGDDGVTAGRHQRSSSPPQMDRSANGRIRKATLAAALASQLVDGPKVASILQLR